MTNHLALFELYVECQCWEQLGAYIDAIDTNVIIMVQDNDDNSQLEARHRQAALWHGL